MRRWGITKDGDSLWWPAIARNKRSVAVDLRDPRATCRDPATGAAMRHRARELPTRPIERVGPRLRPTERRQPSARARSHQRVRSDRSASPPRPASAASARRWAASATRLVNPDRPPTRSGISLGDALASVFAVIGAVTALFEAQRSGRGQEVDVAIYEAVAALMESTMADYELGGVTRGRSGSVLPGVAPSNVYPTADGGSVLIAGNADSVFERLCVAMGAPELATDERFATHEARGVNMARARRPDRRVDGDTPDRRGARGARAARRTGRADLHRARHADRSALPRPRDGAASRLDPGLGRADDRRRAAVQPHSRSDPPPWASRSAPTPSRCCATSPGSTSKRCSNSMRRA